eukprot:CAMPEP_0194277210 /NCGR_PEP_ID=MMETSP0169-20130528/9593_1 /TAXON_ID=218684 /ORGANISM="Corethron pennatum, Strain L29A3" /LENGTH=135 /DNA_ID=CAMNT_0039021117 /DNA_START=214 /DNA_END=621 /DNA_ORIENTATION=+
MCGPKSVPFDLGVVTFALSAATDAFVLWRFRAPLGPDCRRLYPCLILFSHGLVSINYVLGCVLAISDPEKFIGRAMGPVWFAVYCGAFAIIWAGLGVRGMVVCSRFSRDGGREAESELHEETAVETKAPENTSKC